MQLVRYNPWRDLARLERDLDRPFRRNWDWTFPAFFGDLSTVDMYTENGKLIVEADLPGFKKEEVKLNTSEGVLDVTAEHEEREEKKAKREYLLHESSRSYHRQLDLPEGTDADKAEAQFADGKLKVTMPIRKQIEAKEVAIK